MLTDHRRKVTHLNDTVMPDPNADDDSSEEEME